MRTVRAGAVWAVFFVSLRLVFELLWDFRLLCGTHNFVNRLGAHFEKAGYLGDRMAVCNCVTVRAGAMWAVFCFVAVSLPAVQRL